MCDQIKPGELSASACEERIQDAVHLVRIAAIQLKALGYIVDEG